MSDNRHVSAQGLWPIFAAIASFIAADTVNCHAQRSSTMLKDGWEFSRDSINWHPVSVPHDWAIYGPFDRSNDLQTVAVAENGEHDPTAKTGRTGGLPYTGRGFYRTEFNVSDTTSRHFTLIFDGAMSNPIVRLNGKETGRWANGYNAFSVDLSSAILPGINRLEVSLENKPQSSRWYPGAGLYRNVTLLETDRIHIPVWGTYVTTPSVDTDRATVRMQTSVKGAARRQHLTISTVITDPCGNVAAADSSDYYFHGQPLTQSVTVCDPQLWSPETPVLYNAVTRLYDPESGTLLDEYSTRFGIRSIDFRPDDGFYLNGKRTMFKGVCMHHDLGPLGAAVNRSAIRHQLEMLKEMGVNAVRTAHNMPASELVELCEEMGIMLMIEAFDDWSYQPKSPNGYGTVFTGWAEKDITNMVRHFRNSPSVVMWSTGNEVPSHWYVDGAEELLFLQDIIHREDPTRPVTNGMSAHEPPLRNGFAAATDIPGFNYKPQHYGMYYDILPQHLMLGSETASTVSSRGVYHFPMTKGAYVIHPDHQSSSYDVEYCYWSNIPDIDLAADEDVPYLIGQFVWTGFDYLGEPSPYDTDAWPNHSSVFGIIDLASLPKDRYYLYRSVWRDDSPTLHLLPHWTWPGREGEVTPVMAYSSFPEAELFINGKSQGKRAKRRAGNELDRFRHVWDSVRYEPGELTVVAYDENGRETARTTTRTAGKPYRLVLTSARNSVIADHDELVYVTVTAEDRHGNPVPTAVHKVKFTVDGASGSRFIATANGDPCCLLPFQNPEMDLFSGAATAIVAPGNTPGTLRVKASAKGLKPAVIEIPITYSK